MENESLSTGSSEFDKQLSAMTDPELPSNITAEALTPEDKQGIIKRFKEFAKSSNDMFKEEIKRIREEREFYSGKQYDDDDKARYGEGRCKEVFNMLKKYAAAIVNPYQATPYKCNLKLKDNDPKAMRLQKIYLTKIQTLEDEFTDRISEGSMNDTVVTGYGYCYVTFEYDENGEKRASVYNVDDSTSVIPDPFSKLIDGSDSEQMAIVDYIKTSSAKELYGESVVMDIKHPSVGDFGSSWNPPDNTLSLVTYFELRDGHVEFFKLIGDEVVDAGIIQSRWIPIIKIVGQKSWKEDKVIYTGIVNPARSSQKMFNAGQVNLLERLATAPKNTIFASAAAVEGYEDLYATNHKSLNSVLFYNDRPDAAGIRPEKPSFMNSMVQFQDMSWITESSIKYMGYSIGMSPEGLATQGKYNETAEAAFLKTKNAENNTSHFYDHMRASMKQLYRVILDMLCMLDGLEAGSLDKVFAVDVYQGPESIAQREEGRRKLLALSALIPNDRSDAKMLLAYMVSQTEDNEYSYAFSQALYSMLPPDTQKAIKGDTEEQDSPEIKAVKQQALTVIKQLQQQLQQVQQQSVQQMQEKDATIQSLSNDNANLQMRTQADIVNTNTRVQGDIAKTVITANANDNKQAADIQTKLALQAQKDSAKLTQIQASAAASVAANTATAKTNAYIEGLKQVEKNNSNIASITDLLTNASLVSAPGGNVQE
jgi:hypothetical protein